MTDTTPTPADRPAEGLLGPITPIRCTVTGCHWACHGVPDKYADSRARIVREHMAAEHAPTPEPTDRPADQPVPFRYVDEDGFCLSSRLLPDLNAGGTTGIVSITVEGSDEPQSAQMPVAELPKILAGIAESAGLTVARQILGTSEGEPTDRDVVEAHEMALSFTTAAAPPAPADRTDLPDRLQAVLTERYTALGNPGSAMRIQEKGPDGWPAEFPVGPNRVAEVLRELLAEEQPPAPADRAATCICGHPEQQHFEDVCQTCDCADFLVPEAAREMIAHLRRAVLAKQDGRRATVLREAADFVGNDDTCDCGSCDTCVPNKLANGLRALADDAAAGVQPPTSEAEPACRRLTPNEYDRAWHAVEGSAGEEGADPGTVLHAVLRALRIDAPTPAEEQAASPSRRATPPAAPAAPEETQ
ncbi:hypothetical protein [Streptomyces sp. SS07]|uniref:hypothetical protein n=1 Tax=Streptomyces sp. SS07 TaxID=2015315 RepID=UPI000B5CF170|nr:hypothetical protein [Streptomyces sp. SS07]